MTRDDPHFRLRVPRELKAQVEEAARKNNRSLNAEIVARLEVTFSALGDYNVIGVDAITKRLEASIEASEQLAFKLLYELRASGGGVDARDALISEAVAVFAKERDLNKGKAAQTILFDWLQSHGFIRADDAL